MTIMKLELLGFKAIELINNQIDKGVDADGKPFEYSTRPFAMPRKGKFPKMFEKSGRIKYFKSKKGRLWQLVTGGYKDWRRMNNRNPEGDFLNWSGSMLRSMSSRADGANKAVVYFAIPEDAKKAFWFNVSGAGKSRKLWKFFGLTPQNENVLAQFAGENLDWWDFLT